MYLHSGMPSLLVTLVEAVCCICGSKLEMKKNYIYILIAFLALLFVSCSSKIEMELKKDGSIDLAFTGETGKGLEKLIRTSQNIMAEKPVFNTKGIQADLMADNFSNVKVTTPTNNSLAIKMTDTEKKSLFFTSGVVQVKNNKLHVNISPRILVNFYEAADPELSMYLDMLLSPVFNGEEMTDHEYLELVKGFYGDDVAQEIKKAEINLVLNNPDGTKSEHKISLVEVLTLNKSLQLE